MPSSSRKRLGKFKATIFNPTLEEVQQIVADKDKHIAALESQIAALDEKLSSRSKTSVRVTTEPVEQQEGRRPSSRAPHGAAAIIGSKRITKDDESKIVERLSRAPQRERELPPIPGFCASSIDASGVEDLVARLGVADIERRNNKLRELEDTFLAQKEPTKLDSETLAACAVRLSCASLQKKREDVERMREELLSPVREHRRVITPSVLEGCTKRIFYDTVEHKQNTRQKLLDKYAGPIVPKTKLTAEQQKAAGDRLAVSPKRGT